MKILLVDDAAFMRMTLRRILEPHGYEICGEAENGLIAFEKYKATNPDLVFLDLTMEEYDGIAALKLIKGYDKNAKVIICSAMGQQAMIAETIQLGACDFIVKPFQPEKVLEKVKNILGE